VDLTAEIKISENVLSLFGALYTHSDSPHNVVHSSSFKVVVFHT